MNTQGVLGLGRALFRQALLLVTKVEVPAVTTLFLQLTYGIAKSVAIHWILLSAQDLPS